MGYDMYLVGADIESEDNGYFRRNIWGMGTTRDIMDAFEMGHWRDERVKYPSALNNLSDEDCDSVRELVDAKIAGDVGVLNANGDARIASLAELKLSWLAGTEAGKGLAMHKLCSNDGWWVTPEECAAAVAAYERVPEATREKVYAAHDSEEEGPAVYREWFEKWVDFLRRGAAGQGFRVY